MVVTFESDEFRSAGVTSGESKDKLHDLGAGTGETYCAVLDRNGGRGHFGDFQFALELRGEDVTVAHVRGDLLRDEFGRVPEEVGPHALDVVNVLVAVGIPHESAFGAIEEQWFSAGLVESDLGGDAAGYDTSGTSHEFARPLSVWMLI